MVLVHNNMRLMCYFILLVVSWLFCPHIGQAKTATSSTVNTLSLSQLEHKLAEIDTELEHLSHYSLRSGIGAIGYRSRGNAGPDHNESIKIQLEKEFPVDQIILVPTIWRDAQEGFQSYGFPQEFKVRAGTVNDPTGQVIAQYTTSDKILPRIAPFIIPVQGLSLSWLSIEASKLSSQKFNNSHGLQFAEIMVFSGAMNVALHQKTEVSSSMPDHAGVWNQRFLVDGFLPYLMNSARGTPSFAYVSVLGKMTELTVDLGQPYPLTEIRLHTADQSATVPQAYLGDLGLPSQMRVEGSLQADFKDAALLLDYKRHNINNIGPIMMWNIPETTCQFVRFTPKLSIEESVKQFRIGFAEIELISQGQNIALNRTFTAHPNLTKHLRPLKALTDGQNLYGQIISIRSWLEQLAQRHELETLRPQIEQELSSRYTRQKNMLQLVSWLAVILIAGVGFTILISRNIRIQQAIRIKERFAADLHDELGANLHTVRLLGDLAKDPKNSKDELIELLDRSSVFTDRSIEAVRHCTNMLETDGPCVDLIEDMPRTSQRILGDIPHDIAFDGENILRRLKPRQKIDLFLFYKECLINIIRHSGATKVSTRLTATAQKIEIVVTDNGRGLPTSIGAAPPSLSRRTRILKAHLYAEKNPADSSGTQITLTFSPLK